VFFFAVCQKTLLPSAFFWTRQTQFFTECFFFGSTPQSGCLPGEHPTWWSYPLDKNGDLIVMSDHIDVDKYFHTSIRPNIVPSSPAISQSNETWFLRNNSTLHSSNRQLISGGIMWWETKLIFHLTSLSPIVEINHVINFGNHLHTFRFFRWQLSLQVTCLN
jgi:hypothetical protein